MEIVVVAGNELVVTVNVLLNDPGLPKGLYTAFITPDLPGSTGSFVHSGTVQPHEGRTLETIKGALPVLVKVNSQVTLPPSSITSPKSFTVPSSNEVKLSTIAPFNVALCDD